jgi:hypothetical protein
MGIDVIAQEGIDLDDQEFTWRELVGAPISKLDNDAFTRVRIILMNGIESEQNRFLHALARMNGNKELQLAAARVRRIEQHQQTLVNWLNPADQSPLETTIGFEQVAIEVTACVAQAEPDPYLAQVYRFGLLEDFDHMFRYSALMDRLEGRDANDILQSYTDIIPGRPTSQEHREPADDLREPYDRTQAAVLSKLHALTILSGENQTHDYYMTIGPMFSDPLARRLYAEIASIEEQHVTQYESIIDPEETWLEKWLMHELNEVYNYYSCLAFEDDPRVKKVWERFVEQELGHLHLVMGLMERIERRDPRELLPTSLPDPIQYRSQRAFVRRVLADEVSFTANGPKIGALADTAETLTYRTQLNSAGSPSDTVSAGWHWRPGGELPREALDIDGLHKSNERESA